MIKFYRLDRQYRSIRKEILDAIDQTLLSGQVLDGQQCESFEKHLCDLTGRKYAISTNSGTTALLFSLLCAKHLNSVVAPNFSFIATRNAIAMSGKSGIFLDINRYGLLEIDTPVKSSVVMAVNLFGNVCDYDSFDSSNFVIEDAAQSLGSIKNGRPSGSFGNISVLSFDPMKNLPNYGSGGAVLTDDENIYKKIRNLKDNGKLSKFQEIGINSKISEIDCATLNVKLKYFKEWQIRRTQIADYYLDSLKNKFLFAHDLEQVSSWHKFVIICPHGLRDQVVGFCASKQIELKVNYPYVLDTSFTTPNSINFSKSCVSLPIYPELSDSEVEFIATSVKNSI